MDIGWFSYFQGFWVLPLICLLFMAIMMLVCRGTHFRSGSSAAGRCCGTGETSNVQNDGRQQRSGNL